MRKGNKTRVKSVKVKTNFSYTLNSVDSIDFAMFV